MIEDDPDVDVVFAFPPALIRELASILFSPHNADRYFKADPEPLTVRLTMARSERDAMLNATTPTISFEPQSETKQ